MKKTSARHQHRHGTGPQIHYFSNDTMTCNNFKLKATTNSAHELPVAPNLIECDLAPAVPNTAWTEGTSEVNYWLAFCNATRLYSTRGY